MTNSWFANVDGSWSSFLVSQKDLLASIREKVDIQSKNHRILPADNQVLRCLEIPLEKIAVVIVGQDPYPNSADACGLAFAISKGKKTIPGSLRNILKELQNDIGCENGNPDLLHSWSESGVMLLNTTLTVNEGESNSHRDFGWDAFVWNLIEFISSKNPNLVLVLWGNSAARFGLIISPDRIVGSVHPSPLSSHRGFFGSKPFSKVNEILRKNGREPIDWCRSLNA
ncbi:MAG: hypothetical protein RLZZ330_997 [Actinomycetota bacterium]|jgi:uracil-DNA glycosylase